MIYPEIMPTTQAAEYLNVKVMTLANWRHCSPKNKVKIPFEKVGKLFYYKKTDLDAFIAKRDAEKQT